VQYIVHLDQNCLEYEQNHTIFICDIYHIAPY